MAESTRLLQAQRIYTLLIALTSAVSVFAGIAASGEGIANERRVLESIDEVNTRVIVVRDIDGNAELSVATVDRIAGLSHVSWAVGLGPALDTANARLDTRPDTPMKLVVGTSPALRVRTQKGTGAWLSASARSDLHFSRAAGAIRRSDGREFPVVGEFHAVDPLRNLNGLVLVVDPDDESWLSEIIISVDEPGAVAAISEAARNLAGEASLSSISIEAPEVLVDVRDVVAGDLRAQGRRSVFAVLLFSSAVVTVVVFAAVSARRRDLGRRRALGARRSDLVYLVLGHTVMSSVLGSGVGFAAGVVLVRLMTGEAVDLAYPAAVATLVGLASAVAGLGPAVVAALRDPLVVLRSA